MSRTEFSAKIKAAAALRANGHCETCTTRLMAGGFHYDHRIPDAMGGDATLDNCVVTCKACHSVKTSTKDIPDIAKAKRRFNKAHGIKKPRTITGWRLFNGQPRYAGRER